MKESICFFMKQLRVALFFLFISHYEFEDIIDRQRQKSQAMFNMLFALSSPILARRDTFTQVLCRQWMARRFRKEGRRRAMIAEITLWTIASTYMSSYISSSFVSNVSSFVSLIWSRHHAVFGKIRYQHAVFVTGSQNIQIKS